MKNSIAILLLILICSPGFAQDKDIMDPLDVAKIRSVGSIEMSNGKWAAFTVYVQADPLKENIPARSELHLLNLETKTTSPFVTSGSVNSIAFRPGHSSITFLSRRPGDKGNSLYEIYLTGGEALKIFEFDYSISAYEWAPDGNRIAFTATERKKIESPLPYQPEIYEENLAVRRGFIHDVSSSASMEIDLGQNIYALHWAPTGDRLVASIAPTSLVDDSYMQKKHVFVDAITFQKSGEVEHAAKLGMVKISPDGKNMAFIAGNDIHDPVDGRLFTVPTTGGKPKNLMPGFQGKIEDILWSGNNTIAFIASEGVFSSMGTINVNGSGMKTIIKPGGLILDSFEPTNGGYLFNVETPMHPHELYLLEKGKSVPERITNSNPWLSGYRFAKQEVVTYKAKDGVEIQGILIRPLTNRADNAIH